MRCSHSIAGRGGPHNRCERAAGSARRNSPTHTRLDEPCQQRFTRRGRAGAERAEAQQGARTSLSNLLVGSTSVQGPSAASRSSDGRLSRKLLRGLGTTKRASTFGSISCSNCPPTPSSQRPPAHLRAIGEGSYACDGRAAKQKSLETRPGAWPREFHLTW